MAGPPARMNAPALRLYLVRHGETAWSRSGQHTSRTDLELTPAGETQARAVGGRLAGRTFATVFTSPRRRALQTCELAGLGGSAVVEPDLREWDYGDYEGLTSAEIAAQRPGWNLFADGCPGGESPADITARIDALLARWRGLDGPLAAFSHGHCLRVLAVRWLGLPVTAAQHFLLSTASIGILSGRKNAAQPSGLALWNEVGSIE